MAHRIIFTNNSPSNLKGKFVVGSGVGSRNRSVYRALQNKASNNAQGKPCCMPATNIEASTPPVTIIMIDILEIANFTAPGVYTLRANTIIPAGSELDISNFILYMGGFTLTNNGIMIIGGNNGQDAFLLIDGIFINNGTLTVKQDPGFIRVLAAGNFTNAGTFTNENSLIVDIGGKFANNNSFTNDVGATIVNNSIYFTNTSAINNQGTLTNNAGGTISNTSAINNQGTLTNNAGGTISNTVAGAINYFPNSIVTGTIPPQTVVLGNIATRTSSNTYTLQTGVVIPVGANLIIDVLTTLNILYPFTLTGTLTNSGTININQNITIGGTGPLINTSYGIINNYKTITNAQAVTNHGTINYFPLSSISGGIIGSYQYQMMDLTNPVIATTSDYTTYLLNSTVTSIPANVRLTITNGKTLITSSSLIIANGGTLTINAGGALNNKTSITNNGTLTNNGGTIYYFPTSTISGTPAQTVLLSNIAVQTPLNTYTLKPNVVIPATATLTINAGTTLNVTSSLRIIGAVTIDSNGILNNKNTITNNGTLTNNGSIYYFPTSSIVGNNITGKPQELLLSNIVDNMNTLTGSTTIPSGITLDLSNKTITIPTGGALINNGSVTTNLYTVINNRGTITNNADTFGTEGIINYYSGSMITGTYSANVPPQQLLLSNVTSFNGGIYTLTADVSTTIPLGITLDLSDKTIIIPYGSALINNGSVTTNAGTVINNQGTITNNANTFGTQGIINYYSGSMINGTYSAYVPPQQLLLDNIATLVNGVYTLKTGTTTIPLGITLDLSDKTLTIPYGSTLNNSVGTLITNGDTVLNNQGTLDTIINNGTTNYFPNSTITGTPPQQTVLLSNIATQTSSNTYTLKTGVVIPANANTLTINAGTTLNVTSSLQITGAITIATGGIINNKSTITNNGTLTNNGSIYYFPNSSIVGNNITGKPQELLLSNIMSSFINGVYTLSVGDITIPAGITLDLSDKIITILDTTTLINNGTVTTNAYTVIYNYGTVNSTYGTLYNNGTIYYYFPTSSISNITGTQPKIPIDTITTSNGVNNYTLNTGVTTTIPYGVTLDLTGFTLTIPTGNGIDNQGTVVTSSGTIIHVKGDLMNEAGGTFNNLGTIYYYNGSTVNGITGTNLPQNILTKYASLSGGVWTLTASPTEIVSGETLYLTGVTFNIPLGYFLLNYGTVTTSTGTLINNYGIITNFNSFVNNGTIYSSDVEYVINVSGNAVQTSVLSSIATNNSGVWTLNSSPSTIASGVVLDLTGGVTLIIPESYILTIATNGSVTTDSNTVIYNQGTLTNQGNFTNSGTIYTFTGSTITYELGGTIMPFNIDSIATSADGVYTLKNTITIPNGIVLDLTNLTFVIPSGKIFTNNGTVTTDADTVIYNQGTISNAGDFTNSGVIYTFPDSTTTNVVNNLIPLVEKTKTYGLVNASVNYTVPTGTQVMSITATGGRGGGGLGGGGGIVTVPFCLVIPSSELSINVGGTTTNNFGGYNGGGNGNNVLDYRFFGGGGMTTIKEGANILIVAGGGGGEGEFNGGYFNCYGGYGGGNGTGVGQRGGYQGNPNNFISNGGDGVSGITPGGNGRGDGGGGGGGFNGGGGGVYGSGGGGGGSFSIFPCTYSYSQSHTNGSVIITTYSTSINIDSIATSADGVYTLKNTTTIPVEFVLDLTDLKLIIPTNKTLTNNSTVITTTNTVIYNRGTLTNQGTFDNLGVIYYFTDITNTTGITGTNVPVLFNINSIATNNNGVYTLNNVTTIPVGIPLDLTGLTLIIPTNKTLTNNGIVTTTTNTVIYNQGTLTNQGTFDNLGAIYYFTDNTNTTGITGTNVPVLFNINSIATNNNGVYTLNNVITIPYSIVLDLTNLTLVIPSGKIFTNNGIVTTNIYTVIYNQGIINNASNFTNNGVIYTFPNSTITAVVGTILPYINSIATFANSMYTLKNTTTIPVGFVLDLTDLTLIIPTEKTLTNNGTVTTNDNTVIYNQGTISNAGDFTNSGIIYTFIGSTTNVVDNLTPLVGISTTFALIDASVNYTVPTGTQVMSITATGGGGGSGGDNGGIEINSGGGGGIVQIPLCKLTSGSQLTITVGGSGSSSDGTATGVLSSGGYNGGGDGYAGGRGGGMTTITSSANNMLIVAGGGGGGAAFNYSYNYGGYGGYGGGNTTGEGGSGGSRRGETGQGGSGGSGSGPTIENGGSGGGAGYGGGGGAGYGSGGGGLGVGGGNLGVGAGGSGGGGGGGSFSSLLPCTYSYSQISTDGSVLITTYSVQP
jgi:hypothetical protein